MEEEYNHMNNSSLKTILSNLHGHTIVYSENHI